jgi:SAM-dependent methyltransferase
MNENMYDAMFAIEAKHWWFHAKRDIVLSAISPTGTIEIIDFGCGTGAMLESLKRFGNVTGIDFCQKALDFCRKRIDARLLQVNLTEKLPLDPIFDIGVALDVLEHIDDDATALKNIHRVMKPGGKVIITVPAFMSLWSDHDKNCNHKRRYRKKELETLIRNSGLSIEYISYFNFWLFPPIAVMRFLSKLFRIRTNSALENNLPSNWMNKLFYRIFSSERFFVRNQIKLPFGVSLIAILTCR